MTSSIAVEDSPDGPVIAISGDADVTVADALDSALSRLAAEHERIIIDLEDTTLVDSRTIGVLAGWLRELRSRGGAMPIICADDNIRRLFAMIGLDRQFEFFPTRDEAAAG